MPDSRKIIFANNEIYHVFNRGIDRRPTFLGKRGYDYALEGLRLYQFENLPLRLSKYLSIPHNERLKLLQQLYMKDKGIVNILAYCLMPNHFHLLLQQKNIKGISSFVANFTNSYTKYFNAKYKRVGPLFQGLFKAVHIESDEQLMHVSRYIHLNPVSSHLIDIKDLQTNINCSYREYLNSIPYSISKPDIILQMFQSRKDYAKFVHNQAQYAQELERIKHLIFEE